MLLCWLWIRIRCLSLDIVLTRDAYSRSFFGSNVKFHSEEHSAIPFLRSTEKFEEKIEWKTIENMCVCVRHINNKM